MDHLLEQFIILLEEETVLLESLYALLVEKKKAVIEARADELNRVGGEINLVQVKIRQAEMQRQEVFARIARSLDCLPDDLSLEKLSLIVPEPHGTRLKQCRSAVLNIAGRIQEINDSIRALLSHTLQLVATSFNALSGMTAPHTVYGNSGMAERNNHSGRILSRNV